MLCIVFNSGSQSGTLGHNGSLNEGNQSKGTDLSSMWVNVITFHPSALAEKVQR